MLSLTAASVSAAPPQILNNGGQVPEPLGVNIHFTDPQAGEMEMLAEGGFRWVRMDFAWGGIEREKGKYDFSAYDRLMSDLRPHGVRALFILDYSNPFYDGGNSPSSEEGRAAFAKWAAAAADHFRGQNILWEMYNEPNIGFWRPKPDADQYIKLALAVGQAIRRVAPDEVYIGPATSTMDFDFLEKCFRAGLLEYWAGVTVHPYRQQAPETVAEDYARLRGLIKQYAPQGKDIPILSGEWGYSSAWSGLDEPAQGKRLPRQWLINLANDVPVSIWYDWHDDGTDPKEPEHHFGTVHHEYRSGQRPVYEPKPAYLAARTLTTQLSGCCFNKRLCTGNADEYVLLFAGKEGERLVTWTTAKGEHVAGIDIRAGAFAVTSHTGESQPAISADALGLALKLTDSPSYLQPQQRNPLLQVAAAWERAPWEVSVKAPAATQLTLRLANPLSHPIRVGTSKATLVALEPGANTTLNYEIRGTRDTAVRHERLELVVEGLGAVAQSVKVVVTNPLQARVTPSDAKHIAVQIENPSGEPFQGVLRVSNPEGLRVEPAEMPLEIKAEQRTSLVRFSVAEKNGATASFGLELADRGGDLQWKHKPVGYCNVDDFSRLAGGKLRDAYSMVPDGNAAVASTLELELAAAPESVPVEGVSTLLIRYRFDAGWKFANLVPRQESTRAIEGKPSELRMWVYGDGTGNRLRVRFTDKTGQTFQPDGGAMDWRGWRCVTFAISADGSGHWGGADDGVIHYPIHWDSLLLIDSAKQQKTEGTVFLAAPMLVTE